MDYIDFLTNILYPHYIWIIDTSLVNCHVVVFCPVGDIYYTSAHSRKKDPSSMVAPKGFFFSPFNQFEGLKAKAVTLAQFVNAQ